MRAAGTQCSPLSLRLHRRNNAPEHGVRVDHITIHRWAIKILPVLSTTLRRRKRPVVGIEMSQSKYHNSLVE